MADYEFDLFVIGAGSGGVRAARMSAGYGARVAVAEDRFMGGTCVNVGCVPKKLFVYAAHFAEDWQDAAGFGWQTGEGMSRPAFNWQVLRENKDKEILRLNDIYRGLLDNAGVTRYEGRARIVDAHHVMIDGGEGKSGQTVSTDKILIATGSWPDMLDIEGSEHLLSSNEIFYLDRLPEKAVIIGGGYIAVEFAGIFNSLGVETHLLYRKALFMRGFDEDLRTQLAEEMSKKGVHLHFNTEVQAIRQISTDSYRLTLSDGSEMDTGLTLCATGRIPATTDLGLENVPVKTGAVGAIEVNANFQTSVSNIYALGDVIDRFQLTPVAIAEAMVFAANAFQDRQETMDYDLIPTAVFSQPNIGTVGLTEEEARVRYGDVAIYQSVFRAMKHTLSGSDEKTLMKMIVDKASDKVLGVHILGPEAGEIIQGVAIALKAGATKAVFDQTMGIHPTLAEELVTMREAVR